MADQDSRRRAEARTLERELDRRFARAEERLAEVEKHVETMDRLAPSLDMLLGRRTPHMDRVMSIGTRDRLVAEVSALTGTGAAAHHVAVGYATLLELEARGLGRVAGTVQNVVGKLTTAPLLDPPGPDVLEIGALFGLHAAGMYRQLARRGGAPSLTLIDPLEGLQIQTGRRDNRDVTDVPVVRSVVEENLRLAGVPDSACRIVRGRSEEPHVRQIVGDRRYGLVVVDGDHAEEGVRRDLGWTEAIAQTGAVVVVDDYGDPKWPGVQAAVDGHLAGASRLTLLGCVATSAYLRAGEPVRGDGPGDRAVEP